MTAQTRTPVVPRSAWLVRCAGRAPRAGFIALIAILSLAGLLTVLTGGPEPVQLRGSEPATDLAAESFAEAFTRAYLTWDGAHPERHDNRVAAFTAEALESGAGLSVPASGTQEVSWTATVGDEALSTTRRLITVVAQTSAGLAYYVSVPVQRDRRGLMAVSRYPALVGAPPADTKAAPAYEPDVEDQQLQAVAGRAVTNYLRREGTNLRADLDREAVVALPAVQLEVRSIDSISRVGPGRIAVEARAEGRGAAWTLRYELEVVKRERWYVRSIQTNPTKRRSQ
jgi:hypothetical protein